MKLKNYVSTKVPAIPKILDGKLTFVANCALNDNEVKIFGMGLLAISSKLNEDNITKAQLTNVNVILTKDGSFEMIEEDSSTFGLHFSLSVYALEPLRKVNNESFLLFAFIEELVHHYWRISDETKTKYKVLEIVQKVDPHITLDAVKKWGVNGI